MKNLWMLVTGLAMLVSSSVNANDLISTKKMSLELASTLANEAVQACRKEGYQVSAVVVDRHGLLQVAMRDDLASRFTLEIAERKANAVVMSGIASGSFRENRADIRPEINHITGLIMMEGALPVQAAGSLLGAVGVSGAPGGDIDERCAQAAMDKIQDTLDFAE